MSSKKNFKLKANELVQLTPGMGGCIAPDTITVEGLKVKWMYRDTPKNDVDSGWQFFSGTETQEYLDNLDNSSIYAVNTIANYDPAIIPYLNLPIGTELERVDGTNLFKIVPG
ncbi:MAG TPA: DUF2185 domain-containing protein [Puia sp.]|uniref:DUF2185 domain-containing protein n=1 Tax=Puia sp. TaxID=2045100 RepID=UPI002D1D431F|nr:DUF2185 domain-containing protein [Puia sp.]HVU98692.1 DUF2185 domain-containing protein [Puia sp.]